MMEAGTIAETLDYSVILTRLITREDFIVLYDNCGEKIDIIIFQFYVKWILYVLIRIKITFDEQLLGR
jgi:hypothetical protein